MKSRKFLVWLSWLILTAISIVMHGPDENLISWFGTVSIIYIGGNVAQKLGGKQ